MYMRIVYFESIHVCYQQMVEWYLLSPSFSYFQYIYMCMYIDMYIYTYYMYATFIHIYSMDTIYIYVHLYICSYVCA